MKKVKKTRKFFSWNTLCLIAAVCVLNTAIGIAFHGVPLSGVPQKEDVKSISVIYNNEEERTITDAKDIELLVNAANFLNYRLFGKTNGNPIITVTYHLNDSTDVTIEANHTTMWWHGKSHSIKETDVFVIIIHELYFEVEK